MCQIGPEKEWELNRGKMFRVARACLFFEIKLRENSSGYSACPTDRRKDLHRATFGRKVVRRKRVTTSGTTRLAGLNGPWNLHKDWYARCDLTTRRGKLFRRRKMFAWPRCLGIFFGIARNYDWIAPIATTGAIRLRFKSRVQLN